MGAAFVLVGAKLVELRRALRSGADAMERPSILPEARR